MNVNPIPGGVFYHRIPGGVWQICLSYVFYEEILLWSWNLVVLTTIIRTFDFHQKNFTIVMTSSDFADDVIKIGVFDGFSGVPGKNCAVTWVFVAWSWLTPHFKARRLLYTVQLHWLASLIEKSHFGADLIPIIVKIRLKSDKIRQIDVIWRHDVGFS